MSVNKYLVGAAFVLASGHSSAMALAGNWAFAVIESASKCKSGNKAACDFVNRLLVLDPVRDQGRLLKPTPPVAGP